MNNIFPFLDIIILAFLAIFLGFRLKNLLGDRSGYGEDLKNDENQKQKNFSETRNVIHLDQKKISGKGIEALKQADPSFSEDEFINGAKSAFRIIIDAFSDSDLEKLRPLLDYELFKSFTKSISEREAKQEIQNVEIKSFQSIEIIDVNLIDNVASITVKIVSEQVKFITDKNDEMVYGNREKPETIKDKWVFERDISTNNPNWKLVETDIAYD
tara:strand:+ start:1003 stop:1644 length:642 start_codon:yes stop_codon:yes gene_type:complete